MGSTHDVLLSQCFVHQVFELRMFMDVKCIVAFHKLTPEHSATSPE